MSATLHPQAADRLSKILGLLGSDHAGERDAAARAAHKLVRGLGLTWADVIASPPVPDHAPRIRSWHADDWRDLLAFCASHMGVLNSRECEFLRSIARRRSDLTERQRDWLECIAERLRGGL
jgi:hypothetical protein